MPGFYENFIFELEDFPCHIVSECACVWKSSWCHLRKFFVSSAKLTIFISWYPVCKPLISSHYHWNGWRSWLKKKLRNMESRQSCQTIYMMRVKGPVRKQFLFIFRLNTVLHNSYQPDEIVMEIVPDDCTNSSSRFSLSVLKTSIEFLVLQQFDYSYCWITIIRDF